MLREWFGLFGANTNNYKIRYKRDPALDLTDKPLVYFTRIWHNNGNRNRITTKNHFFYVYRCEPVPNIGRKRFGRYFRRFRTTQERRLNQGLIQDGMAQFVRARRNKSNLPDTWDDEIIAKTGKCWKRQSKKRKQWM